MEEFEAINRQIEAAYMVDDQRESLRRLEELWRRLEDLAASCESKFRIRMPTGSTREFTSPPPRWLMEQMRKLRESPECSLIPSVLSTAEMLCCMVDHELKSAGRSSTATLEHRGFGRIDVTWIGENRSMIWIIDRSEIPWPGCNVRVYAENDHNFKLRMITFHLTDDLIKDAVETLLA